MNELIPAILVHDEKTFHERLAMMEGVAPLVHIDVMDGAFVPNRTWFDPGVLASLATPIRFELHLMVMDPARYVEDTRNIESVVRALWHIETSVDHGAQIERCHAMKKEAGIAISPKTPIDTLAPHALALEEILIMGGEPGFSGQRLDPHTIERAWEIHGRWPEIVLGFDIGVNAETIPALKAAGITRFCAASAIFEAQDPVAEAKKLQSFLI